MLGKHFWAELCRILTEQVNVSEPLFFFKMGMTTMMMMMMVMIVLAHTINVRIKISTMCHSNV